MADRSPGGITVATLFAGRHAHLARLLEGVGRSEEAPREVVIVAMGEDPPPDLPDPGVPVRSARVDVGEEGLPLSRARNEAARRARGDGLLMLDVDCVPAPGLIGAAREFLARGDAIGMGTVRYLPPGPVPHERMVELGAAHPALPSQPEPGSDLDPPTLFWSLAFAIRRRTLLETVGGFDEGYVGYGGEDTDFALRAVRAGVPLRWLGGPPAFHQHHPTHSPPAGHLEAIVRNARRFRALWGHWPMEGWLEEFSSRGWVRWEPAGERLEIERLPRPAELEGLRRG